MFGLDPISLLVGAGALVLPWVWRRYVRPALPGWARDAVAFSGELEKTARFAWSAVEALGLKNHWSSAKKLDEYMERVKRWARDHHLPDNFRGYESLANDMATAWSREQKQAEKVLADALERNRAVFERLGIVL